MFGDQDQIYDVGLDLFRICDQTIISFIAI